MANQPRYNIQTGIPGGVMTNASETVTRAAVGLADTVSEISTTVAEQIGIPRAQSQGQAAGADLSWKPQARIGKIGMAYEEAARRANDDAISNRLKMLAESTATELGDKPNGHTEFDGLYTAQTDALISVVTPERREYVKELRKRYADAGKAAVLAANTKNEQDNLKEALKANFQQFRIQAANAASVGDTAGQQEASDRAAETLDHLVGMARRVGKDGKSERVGFKELSSIMYNPDGTLKRDSAGNLIGTDQLYAEAGITFETPPMIPLSEAFKMGNESDKDVAYAAAVGGLDEAVKNGREMDYYHDWEVRLDQRTDIEFEDKQKILNAISSKVRSQRRLEDGADRAARNARKQEQKTDNARMKMDIISGRIPYGSDEEMRRRAYDNAEGDPEGSFELIKLSITNNVSENDDQAVVEINNRLQNNDPDGASRLIEKARTNRGLTAQTYADLQDKVGQSRKILKGLIPYTDKTVSPILDGFESTLKNAQGASGGLMSIDEGTDNSPQFFKDRLALVADSILRETPADKRAAKMKEIVDQYGTSLVEVTKSPVMGTYAGQVRYTNQFLPLPADVLDVDFTDVQTPTGSVKIFDTEAYSRRATEAFRRGDIRPEEYVERVKRVDGFRSMYDSVPALYKWRFVGPPQPNE